MYIKLGLRPIAQKSCKIQIKIMQTLESYSRQIWEQQQSMASNQALIPLLGFPRVHASYTRWNNSKKSYIHLIMSWIIFKNFKECSRNLLWSPLNLCPPFVCLSFALGCSKPVVTKAEHLRKWTTLEGRPKNLMGWVYEAWKFSLRKRRGFWNYERKKSENLTLKFSIVCWLLNW